MPDALGLRPPFNFSTKKLLLQKTASLIGFLVLFLFASFSYAQTFPIRINCGPSGSVDFSGNTFDADQYHIDAELQWASTYNTQPEPFKSVRYTKQPSNVKTFKYEIPVPAGNYDITLHFSEPYYGLANNTVGPGTRIFSVKVENDQWVEPTMDVFGLVGANGIHSPNIENINVVDGFLTIDFAGVANSSGDVNDPIISAIEVMEATASNIAVTGVTLDLANATIDIGGTQPLGATVSPNNATNSNVTWNSSNIAVATVTPSGLVNAVSQGNATITVTTTDGGFTANANINVTNSNPGGDFGSYKLYNATTNAFLNVISDGATYYIDQIGSNEITIEAVAPQSYLDATHGKKVRFNISTSGGADWLEGMHPYFMRGDNGPIYGGWIPPLNTPITFTISYYDNSTGTGTPIESDQFTLTFEPIAPNEPPAPTVYEIGGAGVTNIFYDGENVGIATNPQSTYRLAVEGSIRSREVRVDNDNWADYVFFKDYNLPTLREVEKHIEEKGHLINIPSEAEVEANGIELGEMNKLLLEKIEELTLYIIQQNKSQEQLEERIKVLETQK